MKNSAIFFTFQKDSTRKKTPHNNNHNSEHSEAKRNKLRMADLPKFGMDADLAAKEAAKFNPADEALVVSWISEVTGESKGSTDFMEWLKDGKVLVKLGNTLAPKANIKVNESNMPFKQMENIANFLKSCRTELGMRENDLFTSADLYDGKSRVNTINGLIAVSRAATKAGYKGPSIAPKESKGGNAVHHELGKADASLSKLSLGSAGIMERIEASKANDINFGNKMSGDGAAGATSKLNAGSAGVMERGAVSQAKDINFGAKAAAGKLA